MLRRLRPPFLTELAILVATPLDFRCQEDFIIEKQNKNKNVYCSWRV